MTCQTVNKRFLQLFRKTVSNFLFRLEGETAIKKKSPRVKTPQADTCENRHTKRRRSLVTMGQCVNALFKNIIFGSLDYDWGSELKLFGNIFRRPAVNRKPRLRTPLQLTFQPRLSSRLLRLTVTNTLTTRGSAEQENSNTEKGIHLVNKDAARRRVYEFV
jgi:hypothetical protein